jgi:hypothetical protein
MIGGVARAEVIVLHCKFKSGDKTSPGVSIDYKKGDIKDEFLKIDFEKEKIISAPHYVGFIKPSVLFRLDKLSWYDSKTNYYIFFSDLNRVSGELKITWNNMETNNKWSTLYYYDCSKGNLKF